MTLKIGFILLTHNKPNQILRLTKTLNDMFDFPSIVCHHDFSKCALDVRNFTDNVSFVEPHFVTGWSKYAVVEAMMKSLEMLYGESMGPDWFILLSGSDYPIKPADVILEDLQSTPYNVHIHSKKLTYGIFKEYERIKDSWQRVHFKRYCSIRIPVPYINKKMKLNFRKLRITHPLITSLFLPFSKKYPCYSGEHWFCADRKAAHYLLNHHKENPALAKYFRSIDINTVCPEEAYYHTIFCNAPTLKVSSNNCFRYIDWSVNNGPHPKTLTLEDLPEIEKSSAHFARKLDLNKDPELFSRLDQMVLAPKLGKTISE